MATKQAQPWAAAGSSADGKAPGAKDPPLSTKPPEATKRDEFVAMVREYPMFPGGPTTANVHESEVANMRAADWVISPE